MLKFDWIILHEIKLPLREPFVISSGVWAERRIILVEVHDGEGNVGWGECVAPETPNYSPDTVDTCWLMLTRFLVPLLQSEKVMHPKEVFKMLDKSIRGHMMAKAALEMAGWSLYAAQQGKTLAGVLGGERKVVKTGVSLGIQPSFEALKAKVEDAVAKGYQKIKIKIMPGQDLEPLSKLREFFPDAPMMADANSAYSLDDVGLFKELDNLNLVMIEQPLGWDDFTDHAELQSQIKTPICLDESITSPAKAVDMHKLSAGGIINIKPGRVGGFTPAIAIHDYCLAHKIPVWCGGMLESGIGRAFNVALASLPGFTIAGDLSPSNRYWHRDIVSPEWTMTDGALAVPYNVELGSAGGLGVALDYAFIKQLTVRTWENG